MLRIRAEVGRASCFLCIHSIWSRYIAFRHSGSIRRPPIHGQVTVSRLIYQVYVFAVYSPSSLKQHHATSSVFFNKYTHQGFLALSDLLLL